MKSLNRVNCKIAHETFANKTITNRAISGFFRFQVLLGTKFLHRQESLGVRLLQTPGNSAFQVPLGCGCIQYTGSRYLWVLGNAGYQSSAGFRYILFVSVCGFQDSPGSRFFQTSDISGFQVHIKPATRCECVPFHLSM